MKKEALHAKTKKTIQEWIISGKFKSGEKLPADRKLAENLNVSRITILRALKELEEEGYITREQGRGTYVKNTKPSHLPGRIIKKKIKISFGINGHREFRYFYKYLASLFQQEQPDTEVEIVSVPMSARGDDFPYLRKIASGNAPSVGEFFMHADYAALDGMIPLENMDNYNETINCIHPQLKNQKTRDAKGELHVHALPVRCQPKVILANASLLKEAGIDSEKGPQTLKELAGWLKTLAALKKRKKEEYYAFSLDYPTHCDAGIAYYPYIWNYSGHKEANNKKEFARMLETSGEWLEYICEIFQKYPAYNKPNKGPETFTLGRTGLGLSNGSTIFRLKDCLYPDFEIKAFQIPPLHKGAAPITAIGDMSVGIFKAGIRSEAELEASWRWIRFLLRTEIQTLIADTNWMLPASTKARIPEFSQSNIAALNEAMKNSRPQYDFKGMRQTLTLLTREMLQAIEGKKTSKQALKDANAKILESIF